MSLFVRLHPLLDEVPGGRGRPLLTHGETVSIDLTQSLEQIWSQTRNNHRRDIGKSERIGYVARIDEDWEHFGTFVRLYRETMKRLAAEERYMFDEPTSPRLRAGTRARRPSLWVVTKGDAVAAAVLFTETSGIVQYHLAGTDEDHAGRGRRSSSSATVPAGPRSAVISPPPGRRRRRSGRSLMHFKAGFSDERHVFRTLRSWSTRRPTPDSGVAARPGP